MRESVIEVLLPIVFVYTDYFLLSFQIQTLKSTN